MAEKDSIKVKLGDEAGAIGTFEDYKETKTKRKVILSNCFAE